MMKRHALQFINGMIGMASEWMYNSPESHEVGVRVSFYPSGVVEVHPVGQPLEAYRCANAAGFVEYLQMVAFPVEDDRPEEAGFDPSELLDVLENVLSSPVTKFAHRVVLEKCGQAIERLAQERDWLEGVLQDMQEDDLKYKIGYDDGRESANKEFLRKGRLDVLEAFPLGELSNGDSYLLGMLRLQVGNIPHVTGFHLTPNLWSIRISTFISDVDVDTLTGLNGETREGLKLLQTQLRKYVDGDWIPF